MPNKTLHIELTNPQALALSQYLLEQPFEEQLGVRESNKIKAAIDAIETELYRDKPMGGRRPNWNR